MRCFSKLITQDLMKEVVLMIEGKGLRVTGLDLMTGTLVVKVPEPTGMPQRSLWEE